MTAPAWTSRAAHEAGVARIAAALREAGGTSPLGLAKRSSNLFRDRAEPAKQRLDLSTLNRVIAAAAGVVECEAAIDYEALVDALLPLGLRPAVVPQLKSITVGGAVAGVGIEASAFRCGLVHDTLVEADVLLADGRVLACRADNAERELFLALPNSYGTLGYLTRAVLRTLPAPPFVAVEHHRFDSAREALAAMAAACDGPSADFVEGVAFARDDLVVSVARGTNEAAQPPSDYTGMALYWQSLRQRRSDVLTMRDWLWRWDTDWFWCSRRFGLDRPWLRRLALALGGRGALGSRRYTRWMRRAARLGLARRLAAWRGMRHVESLIQDVDIPWPRAAEFLDFLFAEIGIAPVWLCPIRAPDAALPFTLYPLAPGVRHLNFGFWDTIERREPLAAGHFNRAVEAEVAALGGLKSLYSDSTYTREEFARAFAVERWAAIKSKVDPGRRLMGLYEKCVLRA